MGMNTFMVRPTGLARAAAVAHSDTLGSGSAAGWLPAYTGGE